jgi:predicted AAA+ superfamily ATPase
MGIRVFNRTILSELHIWKDSMQRKPLVLRGARQVGKTTVVRQFGLSFDSFIYLNLELPADKRLFDGQLSPESTVQRIFLEKKAQNRGQTLLFIDEIQQSPAAVAMLRYFYEQFPDLFVIGAGSWLEIMMDTHKISFPVGRVEYRYMFPLSFREFLAALDEREALSLLETIPVPEWALARLFELFHLYALIGGMPEVVDHYRENPDVSNLVGVFQGLLTAYTDDVSKYARNATEVTVIRHVIETAAYEAGKRITFERFGNSDFKSREVGAALRTLERAMLLYLRYPITATQVPLIPDLKRKPRLQLVDTGLLNYAAGLQAQYFGVDDLNSLYKGMLSEHIVAQELMAINSLQLKKPDFWVRELKQSQAEVDFIVPWENLLVPVEVKSGKTGTLRSLHAFIDRSQCTLAVRLYAGLPCWQSTNTPSGTPYRLLSLPYFLASRIPDYLASDQVQVSRN